MSTTPTTLPTGSLAVAELLTRKSKSAAGRSDRCRAELARKVSNGVRAMDLADTLNDLAATEAETETYFTAARIAEATPTADLRAAIADWAIAHMANSDDSWSGRTNDLRRVRADAERQAMQFAAEYVARTC